MSVVSCSYCHSLQQRGPHGGCTLCASRSECLVIWDSACSEEKRFVLVVTFSDAMFYCRAVSDTMIKRSHKFLLWVICISIDNPMAVWSAQCLLGLLTYDPTRTAGACNSLPQFTAIDLCMHVAEYTSLPSVMLYISSRSQCLCFVYLSKYKYAWHEQQSIPFLLSIGRVLMSETDSNGDNL